jgi:hypothetical protein
MGIYPKIPYEAGRDSSVLRCNRISDKTVAVQPDLPGNIIVVHGVNDVGVSYEEVEQGLCAGLNRRLSISTRPAGYRMPGKADKDKLEDDPDDVFFKRTFDKTTFSPVIPFYWGYAEDGEKSKTRNGQKTDRYGNRLDKDLTKGGGPFANATGTLPDMWNRGAGAPLDPVGDPIRPVLDAPGRMYMILAAKRLAALIAMIRDYDSNEAVSLVAHSQGTMLSLLAQAFLMDMGARPADTLVLMNSPYSLRQITTATMEIVESFTGGTDAAMRGNYGFIDTRQSFDSRLSTLVNIVRGVAEKKNPTPAFATLDDHAKHCGMVGGTWVKDKDRDNRGKVYLYFCPEDMTVALDHLHGIGWQGVPDKLDDGVTIQSTRHPMAELTKEVGNPPACGFYQRVFTNKLRHDPATKQVGPVKVGMPPHDFALRVKGEDEHAHVAAANRDHRGSSREVDWPPRADAPWYDTKAHYANLQREGIRSINGEALPTPALAQLSGGQIAPDAIPKESAQAGLPARKQGPYEEVDPIDAATAVAGDNGIGVRRPELIDNPRPAKGPVPPVGGEFGSGSLEQLQAAFNRNKDAGDQCKFIRASNERDGKILLTRYETPNEARLRWQHEVSAKSFHSAVFGNKANHANVTAYDVAIGGGKASSHPLFYAYLCAVADWRLKASKKTRPSIMKWDDFVGKFALYWSKEPKWRSDLIIGNCDYYTSGILPACVPGLRTGLPTQVVCQKAGAEAYKHVPPAPHVEKSVLNSGKAGGMK